MRRWVAAVRKHFHELYSLALIGLQVKEGWVAVPVEPTEEMCRDFQVVSALAECKAPMALAPAIYKAMIQATEGE